MRRDGGVHARWHAVVRVRRPVIGRALGCRAGFFWGWALMLASLFAACVDAPPRARAQRIGAAAQAIGGPKAIGRIGDYLLENDQVRLIIADKGPGRVNTPFGGSLVDADIQRPGGPGAGNDQLAEVLPAFLFSVIEPSAVVVTASGADGGPAEITVRGKGGDLLQTVALLNAALLFPPSLAFEQTYRLYPGKRYVEIETRVTNTTAGMHLLPYVEPAKLRDFGVRIPGIENLAFSVPMGQLLLLGGEQQLFAPGAAGFDVQATIERSYATAKGFPSFPGLPVDYLATRGRGVSYGFVLGEAATNYVTAFAARYPAPITPTSMLLPFTYAGVAAAYTANPPPALQPGEQFVFRSYFVVGTGDAASILSVVHELRGTVTGTLTGRVVDARAQAPVAGANVLIFDEHEALITQATTDTGGAFVAALAPGTYRARVLTEDRDVVTSDAVVVTAKQTHHLPLVVAAPGRFVVTVLDETGRRAPVKVALLAEFDAAHIGADPRTFLYDPRLGERRRPTGGSPSRAYLENQWVTANGVVDATARPGRYTLVVSRGPEYSVSRTPLELSAGGLTETHVRLTREFTTDGWVAADLHLHAAPSTDSDLSLPDRVTSCAAEGLDVAAATDHNFVTDYQPAIAASQLEQWLVGISGMELTTFEAGHFNGYPLRVDPGSTRGGELSWTRQTPAQMFAQLRALGETPGDAIVQINHPRQAVLGYFAQYFVDAETAAPYTPTGVMGVFAPYGDEFKAENFSYDFDAIELMTGKREQDVHTFVAPDPLPPGPFPDPQPVAGQVVRAADGRAQFPGVVETWFALLDRGHAATGVGTSDSHGIIAEEPGYARTYIHVGAGHDGPGGFRSSDVVTAIRKHRAITTTGPMLEMFVGDAMIGDTVTTGPRATVRVAVRAPSWAPANRLVLYANSEKIAERVIPAAQATDFHAEFPVELARDTWVVAEVTGAASMFPVVAPVELPPLDASVLLKALSAGLDLSALPLAAKLRPADLHAVHPYAITNPIWLDRDGDGWTPPKGALARRASPGTAPDVRHQFSAWPSAALREAK